jgi:transposase
MMEGQAGWFGLVMSFDNRMIAGSRASSTFSPADSPDHHQPVKPRTMPRPWGESPEVVLEVTYGWYWAADVLAEAGAVVHLAHPLGVKAFAYRRVKNDERDSADLADLLRMGRLPEAWIAPPAVRGLREAVRHRCKLVAIRSGLKAQVHSVLASRGERGGDRPVQGGRSAAARRLGAGRAVCRPGDLAAPVDRRVHLRDRRAGPAHRRGLHGHRGFHAIQAIEGVGPVLAAVFVAEIGDVHRFTRPQQLCSWAGMTPRHRESDTKVHRGRITKQGNHLVRWAAVEAVQRVHGGPLGATRARIAERRGTNIAKVAAARKLLTLVYWGLRDGYIRCLQPRPA